MRKVTQGHRLGCAVACTAAMLDLNYKQALALFPNGNIRARKEGFYGKDIILALQYGKLEYIFNHTTEETEIPEGSIVFVKRSDHYPAGHYLALSKRGWMDPWINFPKYPRVSGFREKLPGIPQFIVSPKQIDL